MHWSELLHHDQTPYHTSTLEASVGERVTVRLRAPASAPIKQVRLMVIWSGEAQQVDMKALEPKGFWQHFEAEMPLHHATTRYAFSVLSRTDSVQFTTRGARRFIAPFRDWFQFVCGRSNPSWLEDRVFYQIFPDRFKDSDPSISVRDGEYELEGMHMEDGKLKYKPRPVVKRTWDDLPKRGLNVIEHFGGDLGGITQELEYIQNVGANAIYLNPIFTSPTNHRYDTMDYLEVDPHLGGDAALKTLLDAAHARGMRVILDGVFNHTGDKHPFFQAALAGASAEGVMNHAPTDLYTFGSQFGKLGYASFFGVKTMPKLDYANQGTFEVFLEGERSPIRHWLRQGADGWRLDVAHMMGRDGLDDGNLAVHRRLREAARLENPDAYVFGERFWDAEAALQGPDHIRDLPGYGEDGVMNYAGFGLPISDWLSGRRIWELNVKIPTPEVAEILQEAWRVLPEQSRQAQYNLFGSHDIPRMLYRLKGDALKLQTAFALTFAFPGVPSVYYGDEIGMTGAGDPENRAPMIWDPARWNKGVLETVRGLAKARRTSLALRRGSMVWLHAKGNELAFARPYTDASGRTEAALVLASRSSQPVTLKLGLHRTGVLEGSWKDAVTGEAFKATNGQLEVNLHGSRLLIQER